MLENYRFIIVLIENKITINSTNDKLTYIKHLYKNNLFTKLRWVMYGVPHITCRQKYTYCGNELRICSYDLICSLIFLNCCYVVLIDFIISVHFRKHNVAMI